jgi:amylosucrase
VFQENPATGDRRISGTAASLLGIESADAHERDAAVRRLVLAHLVVLGWGGLPLLWMGDELALPNDATWAADPDHADDNRWVHRPRMPWGVAERRKVPGTVEHTVFTALRDAARVRAALPALHARHETHVLDPGDGRLLATVRRSPEQVLVGLYEVGGEARLCPRWAVPVEGSLVDALTGETFDGDVPLAAYAARWLVPATATGPGRPR